MLEEKSVKKLRVSEELSRQKYHLWRHERVQEVEMHDHAFLELTYILKGEAQHTLDGQTATLREGDYLIVDYGSRHSYKALTPAGFDNLDCLFLPELLDMVLKGTKSLRALLEHYLLHFEFKMLGQNPAHMVFHDDTGRILQLLRQMEAENEGHAAGYVEMIRCYLIEILLLTVRQLNEADPTSGQSVSAFLTAYIAEHYMEEISLAALAQRLHYSLPYVSKKFREETGISFVAYLQNYRVMQGCRLLASTRMSLAEIAEAVGYRDVKFFAALVKRFTGLTPAKFRRQKVAG